jgi:hypothetical protein
MTLSLLRPDGPCRTCRRVYTLALLLVAFSPQIGWAQVPFASFNDGDLSSIVVFSGTGAGIGIATTDGYDGSPNAALSVGINPADVGGFAGVVIPAPGGGTIDVTSTSYVTFYLRPTTVQAANQPLTLEVNFQEDTSGDGVFNPAVDDEFVAFYRLEPGSGYSFVQIPLASFVDDNRVFPGSDDGFDFSKLLQIVIVAGGLVGPEFAFAIDEIVFTDAPQFLGPSTEFNFFTGGNIDGVFTFSQTGGGIGVGPIDDAGGTPNNALNVGIDPSGTGGFAGIVIRSVTGTTMDVSEADYITFQVRPLVSVANLPLTLEVNLHEDTSGDGVFNPAVDDEYVVFYRIEGASPYVDVAIPLASFVDDNRVFPGSDDGFDFSKLLEIVIAIALPVGPEYAISFDQFGFARSFVVSNEPGAGPVRASLLSAPYPNPFAAQTRIDLTLDRPETVRVEVLDVLGRRVALLHQGGLAAGTPHTFQVDGSALPGGVYLYRVTGETFAETRRVTLVK